MNGERVLDEDDATVRQILRSSGESLKLVVMRDLRFVVVHVCCNLLKLNPINSKS